MGCFSLLVEEWLSGFLLAHFMSASGCTSSRVLILPISCFYIHFPASVWCYGFSLNSFCLQKLRIFACHPLKNPFWIVQDFLFGPHYGDLWISRFVQLQEPLELGERKIYSYLMKLNRRRKKIHLQAFPASYNFSIYLSAFSIYIPPYLFNYL